MYLSLDKHWHISWIKDATPYAGCQSFIIFKSYLMIKNYLLITLRSLTKNKFFIFVNVFGMGIAIACCIVAYFNYDFNRSFDSYHTQASTIYRVNSVREFQNELTAYGYVPMGMGNAIKQNISDFDNVIRYSPEGS
jgi:putative ABC transport system permease protein